MVRFAPVVLGQTRCSHQTVRLMIDSWQLFYKAADSRAHQALGPSLVMPEFMRPGPIRPDEAAWASGAWPVGYEAMGPSPMEALGLEPMDPFMAPGRPAPGLSFRTIPKMVESHCTGAICSTPCHVMSVGVL